MTTREVRRYEIPVDGEAHAHELTGDPLSAAAVRHLPLDYRVEFWVEHSGDTEPTKRWFVVLGTGHPLPEGARWRATCDRLDGLAWHLYEVSAP